MTKTKSGKGQVQVRHYKKMEPPVDMRQWPNGREFLNALETEGIQPKQQGDVSFWQTAIRWALLKKFDLCPDPLRDPYVQDGNESSTSLTLHFSNDDIQTIASIWEEQCATATSPTNLNDDLKEFLATAMSNGRSLQWSILECGPACQFQLHAHPNLEIIYAVKGSLHEIRMTGSPVTKQFSNDTTGDSKLQGPDLSALNRPWKFATLRGGDWLINEVGSIHKSFSATNGDGCLLLVLWGGSHADVAPHQEPNSVNVQGALEAMDQNLCDCGSKWGTLSETFLPASERSNSETDA